MISSLSIFTFEQIVVLRRILKLSQTFPEIIHVGTFMSNVNGIFLFFLHHHLHSWTNCCHKNIVPLTNLSWLLVGISQNLYKMCYRKKDNKLINSSFYFHFGGLFDFMYSKCIRNQHINIPLRAVQMFKGLKYIKHCNF